MSPDSFDSLNQILTGHIRDWHPPAFTLVWGALFHVTGAISSMMISILFIEWVVWFVFSVYLYKVTGSRKLSILPLVLGFSPIILALSGAVWKDVLMANVLSLGVCLTIMLSYLKNVTGRRLLFVTIVIVYLFSSLLRYNVLLALVPLLYLLSKTYGGRLSTKSAIVGTIVVFMGASFIVSTIVNTVTHVEKTHPESGIMVDDIIHAGTAVDSKNSRLNGILMAMKLKCHQKNIVVNGFIACSTPRDQYLITTKYHRDLAPLWFKTVIGHPLRYVLYRIHAFSLLLFSPSEMAYIWQDGVAENNLGIHVYSADLQSTMRLYIMNFGYNHFPFLFESWFWVIVALVFILRKFSRQISAIALSGLIYILSYIPLTVATDYRYIYWSVWSLLICLILYLANKYHQPMTKYRKHNVIISKVLAKE